MVETLSALALYKSFRNSLYHFAVWRYFLLNVTMPVPVFRVYYNVHGFSRKGQRLLDYFFKAFRNLDKKSARRLPRKLTCYSLRLAKYEGRKRATRHDVVRAFQQGVERAFRRAAIRTLERAFQRAASRTPEPYPNEPYVQRPVAGPKVVVLRY